MGRAIRIRISKRRTTFPPIRLRLWLPWYLSALLVGLSEPWQASQVWARLGYDYVINNPASDEGAVEIREAVLLTVEAVKLPLSISTTKGKC